jgi:hypothetical protein
VPADAYVVTNVVDDRTAGAVAVIDDRVISYTFPTSCITAERPVVYSQADRRVYGPVR